MVRVLLFDLYTNGHHLKYASALAEWLIRQGHEVMLVTWTKDERTTTISKRLTKLHLVTLCNRGTAFPSHGLRMRTALFASVLKTCKLAKAWKADIVHWLYVDNLLAFYLASIKSGGSSGVLGTMFWLNPLLPSRGIGVLGKAERALGQKLLRRIIYKKATGIIVHSILPEVARSRVAKSFGTFKGFTFLYDPVYEDWSCLVSQAEARLRVQLPGDVPIFLFFGELTFSKGLDIAIEAIDRVVQDVRLVIAGRPVYFTAEKITLLKECMRNPHRLIERLGFVPDEEVPFYYLAADAVVMPYRKQYELGTSGIIGQAASAGRPVIAFDVGAIGEVVRGNSLGIVIPEGSCEGLCEGLDFFLKNKAAIAEQTLKSSREYIAKSAWIRIGTAIGDLYSSLVCNQR